MVKGACSFSSLWGLRRRPPFLSLDWQYFTVNTCHPWGHCEMRTLTDPPASDSILDSKILWWDIRNSAKRAGGSAGPVSCFLEVKSWTMCLKKKIGSISTNNLWSTHLESTIAWANPQVLKGQCHENCIAFYSLRCCFIGLNKTKKQRRRNIHFNNLRFEYI